MVAACPFWRETVMLPSLLTLSMRQRSPLRTHTPPGEATVVAAGDDQVTDGGRFAAGEGDLTRGRRCLGGEDALGSCAGVESVHGLDRIGDQDGGQAVGLVLGPGGVCGLEHVLGGAVAKTAVAGVGGDGFEAAGAQIQARGPFPVVGEQVDLGEFSNIGTGRY